MLTILTFLFELYFLQLFARFAAAPVTIFVPAIGNSLALIIWIVVIPIHFFFK